MIPDLEKWRAVGAALSDPCWVYQIIYSWGPDEAAWYVGSTYGERGRQDPLARIMEHPCTQSESGLLRLHPEAQIMWREILACGERSDQPEREVWGYLTSQGIRPFNRPPRTFLHEENSKGGVVQNAATTPEWRHERAKLGAKAGARKAAHARWHKNRGVKDPLCPYCEEGP
jgi:hypothetical protein